MAMYYRYFINGCEVSRQEMAYWVSGRVGGNPNFVISQVESVASSFFMESGSDIYDDFSIGIRVVRCY